MQGGPAPHVNPAFFNQPRPAGPPHVPVQHGPPIGPPHGPQHGGPPQHPGAPPHVQQQHFPQAGGGMPPRAPWPGKPAQAPYPGPVVESSPPVSEKEFEEIMGRNRTVSSSAIARAVSDAAAGEYASAIETLVTAISLIKQSKVSNDDRCKILISSLQDTLHGVETKSYGSSRRERSRSRERSHRRPRRERSPSRYRERDRDRDRERSERERDRYYSESYRDRSRSRDRERHDHYRESREGSSSRSGRAMANKSPGDVVDVGPASEPPKRGGGYYDDRYRERERDGRRDIERDRERDRRSEDHRSRH